jgi:hypothetical protein
VSQAAIALQVLQGIFLTVTGGLVLVSLLQHLRVIITPGTIQTTSPTIKSADRDQVFSVHKLHPYKLQYSVTNNEPEQSYQKNGEADNKTENAHPISLPGKSVSLVFYR